MPAYAVSRTRLLLDGEVYENGARFFWDYDPHTGESWGQILDYHRKGIGRGHRIKRDVIGLSLASRQTLDERIWNRWQAWKLHQLQPPTKPEPQPQAPPPRIRVIGRRDFANFTYGIGEGSVEQSQRALDAGYSTGFFQRRPGQGLPAFGGPGTMGRPPQNPPNPPQAPPLPPRGPLNPPGALGLTFVPPERAAKRPVVVADVSTVNERWRDDGSYYITPGGDGSQKYANALAFIQKALELGIRVELSEITIDKDGTVSFIDGRHRFAALRDLGALTIPVSVTGTAKRARRMIGARTSGVAP